MPRYLGIDGLGKRIPLCLCLLVFSCPAMAQARLGHSYTLEARLDPEAKTLEGRANILWTNPGTAPTRELWFHLYLNAFRDSKSVFFKEGFHTPKWPHLSQIPDENWGGIEVSALEIEEGPEREPITVREREFGTGTGDPEDRTVLRLLLDRPIQPGEPLRIRLDFTSRLPRGIARTGWVRDYFFGGQWFPKLAVYQEDRWICPPYHSNTEYYSDFADYRVDLEVPRDFVVGGSGRFASRGELGQTRYRFEISNAQDFAFVASPRFERRAFSFAGRSHHSVSVQLLLLKEDRHLGDRYIEAARRALTHFEDWFGAYPYPTLTLVDAPLASDTDAMEYPALVTIGTQYWSPLAVAELEAVIYHEIAHQWWYAVVASNEFEEAWLDEGLATWSEMSLLREEHPNPPFEYRWLGKVPWLVEEVDASLYGEGTRELLNGDWPLPITTPSWKLPGRSSYNLLSYTKPYRVLATLEGLVGREAWLDFLRNYFRRFSFRHATTSSFISLAEESLGDSAAELLKTALNSTADTDYSVVSAESRPIGENRFQNEIRLLRKGDVAVPVEILVDFEGDVPSLRQEWRPEPGDHLRILQLESSAKLRRVAIDPERRNWLDVNPVNNSAWAEETEESEDSRGVYRWSARWLIWFQTLLEVLTLVG